ncbi:hypothetical protein EJ03DRAFT_329769 [Teratosphaeria nubilosa]|uniref:Uncharacterized protein n=1 Tax=Teratosphaeria nubilosa TaxID=161662 RepID=A0A6G1L2U1_9PEZI|nr:hypothetical protein EJ03DRAFT_329769 [Teratosphaeria nubilosa]
MSPTLIMNPSTTMATHATPCPAPTVLEGASKSNTGSPSHCKTRGSPYANCCCGTGGKN